MTSGSRSWYEGREGRACEKKGAGARREEARTRKKFLKCWWGWIWFPNFERGQFLGAFTVSVHTGKKRAWDQIKRSSLRRKEDRCCYKRLAGRRSFFRMTASTKGGEGMRDLHPSKKERGAGKGDFYSGGEERVPGCGIGWRAEWEEGRGGEKFGCQRVEGSKTLRGGKAKRPKSKIDRRYHKDVKNCDSAGKRREVSFINWENGRASEVHERHISSRREITSCRRRTKIILLQ